MSYLHQLDQWSNKHQYNWFVVLRVVLGLCLFFKGIQFIKDAEILEQLITKNALSQNFLWLNDFIPWLHLSGGIMILIGLFTRLSVILQIPVLVGAVFFTNSGSSILTGQSDLIFSLVVLLLLFFFLVEGGGPISLDKALRKPKRIMYF